MPTKSKQPETKKINIEEINLQDKISSFYDELKIDKPF